MIRLSLRVCLAASSMGEAETYAPVSPTCTSEKSQKYACSFIDMQRAALCLSAALEGAIGDKAMASPNDEGHCSPI